MNKRVVVLAWVLLASGRLAAAGSVASAIGVDNVHIRVPDPDKAAAWYVSTLGATPSKPPAPGTAQVTFGPCVITIIKGDTVVPSRGTLIDHIGLSYPDVDAAVRKAAAAGATVTTPPAESPGIFRYAYIEDPWGVRIEIVQDADRLGFHHVHLRVPDPAATLAWFAEQFGGERTMLRGKVDGVRFNGVWLFAMKGDSAPPAAIQLVAFRVGDVDASLNALNGNGVKTASAPRDLPGMRYAFVEDPNKIRVELVKRTVNP
jgi:catechol 2,3-dioxygenase-like lactoylglutathione lyase family enzyme